jgi:hypothetical protein
LRDLPPGSSLEAATGHFTWSPGAGYVGTYDLVFVAGAEQILVAAKIEPVTAAVTTGSQIHMAVDLPQTGQTVSRTFTVAGWAFDPQASIGTGIGAVHVWAQRLDVPAASPVFLGVAELGGAQPDVAQAFGAQFDRAGYSLTTASLAAGRYDVTVYVWNRRTARWEDARTVAITVR